MAERIIHQSIWQQNPAMIAKSFTSSQDEVDRRWHPQFDLILSEVEGRGMTAPKLLLCFVELTQR
jgi:hypothetical protein